MPVGKVAETCEYVIVDEPSTSVATTDCEYATVFWKLGKVDDVVHEGEFPAVTEFDAIWELLPIGAETFGFNNVKVINDCSINFT